WGPDPCRRRTGARAVPRGVRGQVPQGACEARPRLEAPDRVLRLPRRALATSPDEQRDRQLVRDGQAPHPTRVTKGAGSKKAALAMAYKLLDAARERWRRFNGRHLVTDVLGGANFILERAATRSSGNPAGPRGQRCTD